MTRFVAGMLSAGLMVLGAGVVSGQNYPNKTIRIVTSAVGGSGDITSRLVAQELSGPLGQPVIVDNRPTFAAIELVAKAPPDGYTVLESGSAIWITPLLQDNVPWDPVRDFSPITQVERSPNILVVHPSLPVKSVKELIALAKARPGELNYSCHFSHLKDFAGVRGGFSVGFPLLGGTTWIRSFSATAPVI